MCALAEEPRSHPACPAQVKKARELERTSGKEPPGSGPGERIRILVANEPRSYREALCGALKGLRPLVDVTAAEPEDLDRAVERLNPHLVVCSHLTSTVENVPAWIELYPGGAPTATVCLRRERTVSENMNLESILSILDRIERLFREERP